MTQVKRRESMKPGEQAAFYCENCLKRFAIHYEPSIKPGTKGPDGDVTTCPFCGDDGLEVET